MADITTIETFFTYNDTSSVSTTSVSSEDEYLIWPFWSAILLAVIAVIGTTGNIFIIAAVFISSRLRTRGNAFVINLAVADFIVCAYIMPMGIATSQKQIAKVQGDLCEINAFITLTTCGVSTQTLMLIAIERYFHICQTKLYNKVFSNLTTTVYIVLIWLYTMAWTCQGWTGWTKYIDGGSAHVCLSSNSESLSFTVCLAFFGMVLPMIVLAILYWRIFKTVSRSNKSVETRLSPQGKKKKSKREDRELQLLMMLVTIVVIFIICWLPVCIVLVVSTKVRVPTGLFIFVIWLAMCNSSFNSFVYGFMNKNFQQGYKRILYNMFCCCMKDESCKCVVHSSTDEREHRSAERRHSFGGQTHFTDMSGKSTGTQLTNLDKDEAETKIDGNANGHEPTRSHNIEGIDNSAVRVSMDDVQWNAQHPMASLEYLPHGDFVYL